jgi:hypothetical protein
MRARKLATMWAVVTLVGFALVTYSQSAGAVEVTDPLIKEWLEIVGEDPQPDLEWEKKWVGKTIDASNVDEVKDLIPQITYNVVKEMGGTFKIEAAKIDYRPSKGWIEATKANMENKPYLNDDMVLHNFVGGCPFPRPEMDPVKIAWNRDRGTQEGDDFIYRKVRFYVVNPKGKGRTVQVDYSRMRFAYRTDLEPIPEIPNNTSGVYRSTQFFVMEPFDLRGLNLMVIKYKDSSKQDDVSIYVPTMRRVRRMSAGQRCDSMAGTDVAWEDADIYDGEVRVNEYKMIGKKDQLLAHLDYPYPEDVKLEGLWVHGIPYSKRPCYVMEANSKIPNFCYSKRIWYIDPISSRIYSATLYDRKGRLWKEHITAINRYKKDPNKPEGAINNPNFINYVDWQARHGSPWLFDSPKSGEKSGPYTNSDFAVGLFTVEGIKKGVH